MGATWGVEVEGLRELRRGIRGADKATKQGLKEQLKGVGQIVATEGQRLARAQGLDASGKLIGSIKPRARATAVVIVASSKRKSRRYPKGFPYPRRYEYQARGRQSFLRRARTNKEAEVFGRFKRVLEDAGKEFASG